MRVFGSLGMSGFEVTGVVPGLGLESLRVLLGASWVVISRARSRVAASGVT